MRAIDSERERGRKQSLIVLLSLFDFYREIQWKIKIEAYARSKLSSKGKGVQNTHMTKCWCHMQPFSMYAFIEVRNTVREGGVCAPLICFTSLSIIQNYKYIGQIKCLKGLYFYSTSRKVSTSYYCKIELSCLNLDKNCKKKKKKSIKHRSISIPVFFCDKKFIIFIILYINMYYIFYDSFFKISKYQLRS